MTTKKQIYSFFRPELRDASYATGDVYTPDKVLEAQKEWDILSTSKEKKYPYLAHVKSLSVTWPHLRLLADFMEVSTTPTRWGHLRTEGKDSEAAKVAEEARNERASRTTVTRLDYSKSGDVTPTECKTPEQLISALKDVSESKDEHELRLFVVEDLSRDVIEALGSSLDIEPAFFREHIADYAWYNIRDRWQDPPNLHVVSKKQRWLQLRWVTARYFNTSDSFERGVKEAENFNCVRRPDDDVNNKAVWDDKNAIVGITRTRASFWLRHADANRGAVGVLLLDPTIKEGQPLWYGYRNWEETPGVGTTEYPPGPPRDSLYNDFIFWAKKTKPPQYAKSHSSKKQTLPAHVPVETLLHLICAEWLTIADYIRTRIGQIEWEVSIPDHFLNKGIGIDEALKKLHVWRRLVPLYREMLSDTLQRVFHFPCHAHEIHGSNSCSCASHHNSSTTNTSASAPALGPPAPSKNLNRQLISYSDDFTRVLSYMEEYQSRIDRLTSVVTAIISIDDSRRGQDDNRNVARLTWLATFFIPLSYMASLFSMQSDVSLLVGTYKLYFETALPLAVVSLGLAWVLTMPWFHGWVAGALKKIRG
ncbi:hypothetical protein G7Y89_g12558 [Cudoniella acicularis]|uniref:Uncharacterized protein n=1 Tax=Cudoniella acicularis TaxID=354080 RepID=A0A8H4RA73_9HELO|nr:hypothetical protein G7Y89_g12558 [Cudoniella acicularis]